MKKYHYIALILAGLCLGGIQQQHLAVLALSDSSGTDLTADGNCIGAWDMSGDTTDNETDQCSGGSETLLADGNSMATSASVPSGFSGESRDFEFTDTDYMEVADGSVTDISGAEQAYSICGTFDLEDTATDGYLIAKWDSTTDDRQFLLKYESSSTSMECRISNDGSNQTTVTGSDDVSSGFHSACCVHDPVNNLLILYVDGGLDNSGAWTNGVGVSNTTAPFRVGASGDDARPWDGLIYEIYVSDRVLTGAETLGLHINGMFGNKGA
jgi:hypothetical protein